MLSYKKIDMLNLVLTGNSIYYNGENLLIKSPIINFDIKDDKLMLIINSESDAHSTFLNLCSYIERIFKNVKTKTDIIKNRNDIKNICIIISIDENSKFYDIDRDEIFKNNIKSSGKLMCSFSCKNGKLFLCQLLQIK